VFIETPKTVTLDIMNVGGGTLDWTISEMDGLPLQGWTPEPLAGPFVAAPAAEAVGDGAGIDAPAPAANVPTYQPQAVLYDNGPLVTHPGGGFNGADASVLQTALGLTIYGFGAQISAANSVADDFTVPAGGWDITSMTFFSYQTGSPTDPPTINDVRVQIWDGVPTDPGSQVVFGDLSTNRLESVVWSGMYRVLDTDMMNTQRPPMAVVATVNVSLPVGTYWVEVTLGGTLASGPWAPPVSLVGELGKPGANGLQNQAGLWVSLLDGVTPQDIPFLVNGAGGGPVDVPWLSENPTSGQNTVPVDVTFDPTGMSVGDYFATLVIASNDVDEPTVYVPVTMTIVDAVPVISVDPTSLESTQIQDEIVALPLTISNLGNADLEWSLYDNGTPLGGLLVDWSENFDSYANDSQMHGQGGWKGWFNDPNAGAFVRDDQAHSAPHSVEIAGASDLVHEYSGYTTGTWTYTAWQYIPSSVSGITYFILLNSYDDAGLNLNWSLELQFDTGLDTVLNDGPDGGSLPIIYDQWVEIRDEIDLDNDTQTVFYGGVELFTGSWANGMSGGGVANIAAVDLFANLATPVYYDDVSLMGPPAAVCDIVGDIPWLSVDPESGVTPGGESALVDVFFDATSMAPGVYSDYLCAASNDPETPIVSIPGDDDGH
jgi:hypothetical protein